MTEANVSTGQLEAQNPSVQQLEHAKIVFFEWHKQFRSMLASRRYIKSKNEIAYTINNYVKASVDLIGRIENNVGGESAENLKNIEEYMTDMNNKGMITEDSVYQLKLRGRMLARILWSIGLDDLTQRKMEAKTLM